MLHVGPLPPPELLKQYDKETRALILKMAGEHHGHTIKSDEKLIDLEITKTLRGQFLAFVTVLFGLGGAVFCAYLEQPWVAGLVGGATVVELVTAFLGARKRMKTDSEGFPMPAPESKKTE